MIYINNLTYFHIKIALPAPGMSQLRDALNELIDKYAEGFVNEVRHCSKTHVVKSIRHQKINK